MALGLVATSCTPALTPSSPSEPTSAVPSRLLFVERTTLMAYHLASGVTETITELPTADVALSPNGDTYAVVRETHPQGPGPEGFRRPVVMIGPTSGGGEQTELGPGRSPLWSPGGTEVAAIAPVGGGEQIVAYRASGEELGSSPADRGWSLVGWRPGEVVAIGADAGPVIVPARDGEVRAIDVPAPELWGASPTEATLMTVSERGAQLRGAATTAPVRGLSGPLGDGAWSWTGRHVVAVEITGARSSLVLIDVASGRSIDVGGGRRAQGNVVWSKDGKTFAYVRVNPDDRSGLQAVVCGTGLECKPAFSWTEGIRLLGFL